MNQNTSITYCFLDFLPKVPADLLEGLDAYKQQEPLVSFVDRTALGNNTKNSSYQRFGITGRLRQWLQFNIVRDPIDFGIAFDNIDAVDIDHHPHVDNSRQYSLNYIITAGGDNVLTNFYQETGKAVERDYTYKFVTDYRNLNLIDSVQVPAGRWILVNTRVIHSITNLKTQRNSIQISLDSNNKFII